MATIKKHLKKKPFTIVENDFLNNDDLYFSAKGLFTYMISKPANWNFTIKSIKSQSKDGQSRVTTALDELKKLGFIHYEKLKSGSGIYHLYENPNENPNFENPNKAINPSLENPSLENPNLGNSKRISNTILNSNKEESNKKNKQKKVCVSSNDFTTEIKAKDKSVLEAMKDLNIDLSKFSSKDLEVLNSVENTAENREALDIGVKAKTKKVSVNTEHVERIYKAYPTTCPTKKNSTAKSRKVGNAKSKQILLIERLLKTFNVSELETYTKKYISDCTRTQTYIKGFYAFLNSVKDNGIPKQEKEASKKSPPRRIPLAKAFS